MMLKPVLLLNLLSVPIVLSRPAPEDVSLAWNGLMEWMPLKVLQGHRRLPAVTLPAAIHATSKQEDEPTTSDETFRQPLSSHRPEFEAFTAGNRLDAKHEIELVFAADAPVDDEEDSDEISFATVHVSQMKYPTIQPDHSPEIRAIYCLDGKVHVLFDTSDAAMAAQEFWSKKPGNLVLATNSPSCSLGASHTAFVLIKAAKITTEKMRAVVPYKSISFHEAITPEATVQVNFGKSERPCADHDKPRLEVRDNGDSGVTPIKISTADDFGRGKTSNAKAIAAIPVAASASSSTNATFAFNTRLGASLTEKNSLWGSAYELYTSYAAANNELLFAVYCVGCGFSGNITTTATFTFTTAGGVATGYIGITGSVAATLNIGAASIYGGNSWLFYQEIGVWGLAPMFIPGVLTVSPTLSLEVQGSLSTETMGEALAGATFFWPSIQAQLDVVTPALSVAAGFDSPIIVPKVDLKEDIIVNGLATMVFNLTFQVTLLDGLFKNTVGLIQTPSLDFNITQPDVEIVATSTSSTPLASPSATAAAAAAPPGCSDETLSLFSAGDVGVSWLNLSYYHLTTWTGPYWATCITGAVE